MLSPWSTGVGTRTGSSTGAGTGTASSTTSTFTGGSAVGIVGAGGEDETLLVAAA